MTEEKIRIAIVLPIIICSIFGCSEYNNCSPSMARKISYIEMKNRFPGRVKEYAKLDVTEDQYFWNFKYSIPKSFGGSSFIKIDKRTCAIHSVLSTQ